MDKLDKSNPSNEEQSIEDQKKQYLGGENEKIKGFYDDNEQSSDEEDEKE